MRRLDNFGAAGGAKLYPAEFKYQIKQARAFTGAVVYLLGLFNANKPKVPGNRVGLRREVLNDTNRHAA